MTAHQRNYNFLINERSYIMSWNTDQTQTVLATMSGALDAHGLEALIESMQALAACLKTHRICLVVLPGQDTRRFPDATFSNEKSLDALVAALTHLNDYCTISVALGIASASVLLEHALATVGCTVEIISLPLDSLAPVIGIAQKKAALCCYN